MGVWALMTCNGLPIPLTWALVNTSGDLSLYTNDSLRGALNPAKSQLPAEILAAPRPAANMLPTIVCPRRAASQPGNRTLHLEDLPVETMIEVISHLDFEAFDSMLRVNRRLRSVIESYWSSILPGIIAQEFAPVEGFFHAFGNAVSPGNKLRIGDFPFEVGNICSQPPKPGPHHQFPNGCPPSLSATKGLHSLLNFCRVIRRWEMEFPCLRFSDHPEYNRSLRPHERCRLRQGLYVWWRFARHFHGSPAQLEHSDSLDHYSDYRSCGRRPDCSPEVRRAFMRELSTTQLHDVYDMWATIRSAVGREVCPSVAAVREWSVSWKGDALFEGQCR